MTAQTCMQGMNAACTLPSRLPVHAMNIRCGPPHALLTLLTASLIEGGLDSALSGTEAASGKRQSYEREGAGGVW
jgi:hypothetical protein